MKGIFCRAILIFGCILVSASFSGAFANTVRMTASLSSASVSHISKDKDEQSYILSGERNTPVSVHISSGDYHVRADQAYNNEGVIKLPASAALHSQSFITIEHQ